MRRGLAQAQRMMRRRSAQMLRQCGLARREPQQWFQRCELPVQLRLLRRERSSQPVTPFYPLLRSLPSLSQEWLAPWRELEGC